MPDGAAEVSLSDALALNPGARRVRWRPGTRMAYSNVGYGVAGVLIEKATDEPYEDYIKRAIFDKLDMPTSSFRLTTADEALLARGYGGPTGPPVGFPRIYLRPAGNLHSSPRELAQFVRMILNWGEIGTTFVVDPEYLGNMEQPRTTLAVGRPACATATARASGPADAALSAFSATMAASTVSSRATRTRRRAMSASWSCSTAAVRARRRRCDAALIARASAI